MSTRRLSVQETRQCRVDLNERILSEGNKEINRFFALDAAAYREGALSVRTKELMGLVASMALRCNDCIFYHLDRCVNEGASKAEILEAMNISLVIGGSIVIPHLRYAFETLEALLAEAEEKNDPVH